MEDDGARGSRDVRLFPRSAVSRTILRADTPPRNPAALAMQPSGLHRAGRSWSPAYRSRRAVACSRRADMRDARPRGSSAARPRSGAVRPGRHHAHRIRFFAYPIAVFRVRASA
ncbi:hypothetical protein WS70_11240 [Burkholderia mayonis]|uniref:Uncharacterized protein n=1 Tax=Burkholderia mayonis TaxID=1385591 RepID=A0A1B4FF39_9BURK|nr:hypothetical protein WS70_11240 [Burkholderia mayonis]KVE36116.1 hypothetical protein WS69_12865 [Burkholderia sp. BDU5]KVE47078.1 hypothetical protein WS70_28035 [Burkholderia mayonis]